MTIADAYLAQIAGPLDEWLAPEARAAKADEPHSPAARAELAMRDALRPTTAVTIRLGHGDGPGFDPVQDASWAAMVALARRDLEARRAAGVDAGLDGEDLRLLAGIDALIGSHDEGWADGVRSRLDELTAARRRGRRRRAERVAARVSEPSPQPRVSDGWLARHPADHWLRGSLPNVRDPGCRASMTTQVARCAPSYSRLCERDWSEQEAAADVVCDVEITAASTDFRTPITVTTRDETSATRTVVIRQVEDLEARFDGTLISALVGERWHVCARRRDDGSLVPLDGSRRIA